MIVYRVSSLMRSADKTSALVRSQRAVEEIALACIATATPFSVSFPPNGHGFIVTIPTRAGLPVQFTLAELPPDIGVRT